MSEITKEQILQLEQIGLAIADKMEETCQQFQQADNDKQQKLQEALKQSRALIQLLEKGE